MTDPIAITYYSDLLCVWAYVSQIRLDELRDRFADRVEVAVRFCPVFGDTATKIGEGWRDRGGFRGYAGHARTVVERFDHVEMDPGAWVGDPPASSLPAHAVLKAVQRLDRGGELPRPGRLPDARGIPADGGPWAEVLSWRLRLAFFAEARNIARREVQAELLADLGLPVEAVMAELDSGRAYADLQADYDAAAEQQVPGSPTFVIDGGRQKLYGNVGYRVIEANVQEVLRGPAEDQASWC